MPSLGKTIQIYLPDGEPSGVRIAELTTRIVQAIAVPRFQLGKFYGTQESDHVGAYFLFGGDEESTKPLVYIGQTEDFKGRFKTHDGDKKKEFWTTAVVIISRTHSFTQAHIRWLEWKAIATAANANRYRLVNGNAGGAPFITEPIRADLEEIFETASILLESLGFPVFRPLVPSNEPVTDGGAEKWFLKGPDASAEAMFTEAGFVVLKGSKCRRQFAPSANGSSFAIKRQKMEEEGALKQSRDSLVFTEDVALSSPSFAAAIVLARHANGWTSWRDSSGRTLDQVKRGSENVDA